MRNNAAKSQIIVPTTEYQLYVWSAISPITNELEEYTCQPSFEQTFWKDFEVRKYHRFDIRLEKWELGYWDEPFEYRVLWTDGDDGMCHRFFETIDEAMECVNSFEDLKYMDDVWEMIELYELKFW